MHLQCNILLQDDDRLDHLLSTLIVLGKLIVDLNQRLDRKYIQEQLNDEHQ